MRDTGVIARLKITVGHRTIVTKIQVLTGKILAWSDTMTFVIQGKNYLCANMEHFDLITGPQYQLL